MAPRMRIKICGITNRDDALRAAELGADALGFIFFTKSPRHVHPETARAIIEELPPFITPVAVIVNEPISRASDIMVRSGCQVAQLHGTEPPEYFARLAWPAIKGISIAASHDLAAIAPYSVARAILLDTKVAGQFGGTGTSFDWQLAREAKKFARPIILAGGLSPENVAEAITIAQPDAIDVSSRIESEPGKKDQARMKALFAAIRGLGHAE